jgi:hypothetical protein
MISDDEIEVHQGDIAVIIRGEPKQSTLGMVLRELLQCVPGA